MALVALLSGADSEASRAALAAGVAYVNHREADLGSLRPGHLADIAVLDHDILTIPLTIPPGETGSTRVDLTIAGGEFVHRGGIAAFAAFRAGRGGFR